MLLITGRDKRRMGLIIRSVQNKHLDLSMVNY